MADVGRRKKQPGAADQRQPSGLAAPSRAGVTWSGTAAASSVACSLAATVEIVSPSRVVVVHVAPLEAR